MNYSISLDSDDWTEERFLELDVMPHRIQLFDGSLFITPDRTPIHQFTASALLAHMWKAAEEADLYCHHSVAVRLRPQRIPIPDLVLSNRVDLDGIVLDVAEVLMVGEVLSPSSAMVDETLKMRYYAEAEIPWYLLLEPWTAKLRLYRLEDGRYIEHASVAPGELLEITDPLVVTIDPADLLPPR